MCFKVEAEQNVEHIQSRITLRIAEPNIMSPTLYLECDEFTSGNKYNTQSNFARSKQNADKCSLRFFGNHITASQYTSPRIPLNIWFDSEFCFIFGWTIYFAHPPIYSQFAILLLSHTLNGSGRCIARSGHIMILKNVLHFKLTCNKIMCWHKFFLVSPFLFAVWFRLFFFLFFTIYEWETFLLSIDLCGVRWSPLYLLLAFVCLRFNGHNWNV